MSVCVCHLMKTGGGGWGVFRKSLQLWMCYSEAGFLNVHYSPMGILHKIKFKLNMNNI
jgi:hypothetical protein